VQYAEENRPSNDGGAQAFSGYAWMSSFPGQPPLKSRLYVCDAFGALMGELAVLATLHYSSSNVPQIEQGQGVNLDPVFCL
jgi:crotonobetainyl-CoA:carnitine CoA-transferase CaiB-like acyl-CoA transferase